jgi:glutamate/tyrosine decarboxylase-like PLP-dependent enzyme
MRRKGRVAGVERRAPVELEPDEFRALGHRLVDEIAELLEALRSPSELPVTPGETVAEVQAALGDASLPEHGTPPDELLREARELLFEHSLHTGHPRFLGYVIGAPAPLGALGDFLAAAVNPNLGGYPLAPIAIEIERQTVRWIAELIGYPADCGGLLVSGGNMANFVGFLAARRARAGWDVRAEGMSDNRLRAYCSAETHTWVQKAADMFGIGTDAVRWIPTDGALRMDVRALREAIAADRIAGDQPFLVIGSGGSVSTGAVDPLRELAELSRAERLWLHVDGAYGAFAACAPGAPDDLRALGEADSVALDPHKWLYAPTEAGCALVRRDQQLLDTFDFTPPYYRLHEDEFHYYKRGPQNSRGFRALKVWLGLRHLGREGYARLIEEDMELARYLDECVAAAPELESGPGGLSIATFRYVPEGIDDEDELNRLNQEILDRLQAGGEAFVSVAVVEGRCWLRACVVNFRTTRADMEALVELVTRLGADARATVA